MIDAKDFRNPEYCAEIKKSNLHLLAMMRGGFQFATPDKPFFPYTSGEIGNYYVQAGVVMKDGVAFKHALDSMTGLVERTFLDRRMGHQTQETGFVSGGESRDWIFSQAVAANLELPHMMIYKDGKVVGFNPADFGVARSSGIHVADLNNEGSSVRDKWLPTIRKLGGGLNDVFFYVDRMEDGVKVVEELGLRRHAVVELDGEAWQYLRGQAFVSEAQYESLMERLEDKEEWARSTLRTPNGILTLAGLLIDYRTRAKGEKILNVGYPDMREELREPLVGAGVRSSSGVEFVDADDGRLIVKDIQTKFLDEEQGR